MSLAGPQPKHPLKIPERMTGQAVDVLEEHANDTMAQFGKPLSAEFVSWLDRPKDLAQCLAELRERDWRVALAWELRRRDGQSIPEIRRRLGNVSQATVYRLLAVGDKVMAVFTETPAGRLDLLRARDEDAWIVWTLRGAGWYLEQIGHTLEQLRGTQYTMAQLKGLSVKANTFVGAAPHRRRVERYAHVRYLEEKKSA